MSRAADDREDDTVVGVHPFNAYDWFLLCLTAAGFGSAFLFIAVALRSYPPGAIALGRLLFGLAAIAAVPAARKPVTRTDWPWIAVLAVSSVVVFPLSLVGFADSDPEPLPSPGTRGSRCARHGRGPRCTHNPRGTHRGRPLVGVRVLHPSGGGRPRLDRPR